MSKKVQTTLPERLKAFRSEVLNKSQYEIAPLLGLKQNTYAAYEVGRSEPSIKILVKIAELGCNIDWLLTGNGIMKADSVSHLATPPPASGVVPDAAAARIRELELENSRLNGRIEELRHQVGRLETELRECLQRMQAAERGRPVVSGPVHGRG